MLRAVAEHAPWGNLFCFLCLFFFILLSLRGFLHSHSVAATMQREKWGNGKRKNAKAGVLKWRRGYQEAAQQKASRGTNDFDSINVNALARIACERGLMYAIYGITGKRQVPGRGKGMGREGGGKGEGGKRRRLATGGNWELINQSVFSFKSFEVLTSSV